MFDIIKILQNNSSNSIKKKQSNLYNKIISKTLEVSKEGRTFIRIEREPNEILKESHYEEVMQRLKLEGFKITKSHHKVTKSRKIYTISWGNK